MNHKRNLGNRIGSKVLLFLLLTFVIVPSATAAPLAAEGSIIGPVIERIIVIAGAALVLAAWDHWRSRKKKSDTNERK